MTKEIKIPAMGESISEAIIGRILKPSGTFVKADEEVLELETDKVNQVLYAPQTGQVNLSVKEGDRVKIGQLIGTVEDVATERPSEQSTPPPSPPKEKPKPAPSPPAREGQIRQTREEFLAALHEPVLEVVASLSQTKPEERETKRPMSNLRKVVASRLVEAQRTMAMLTTFNEIDLSQVIQLRERHQENFQKKYQVKLGFMSFFVKAVVSALKAFPILNAYIVGDEIVDRHYYDIGIAVGTERGLIVPVLRDSDQLSFAQIETAIADFSKRAKEGRLTVQELQGGGFTITNGGVYGSLLSTPIVNPPQSGILGMHKIQKRPVVVDDQIVIRSMMYVALSYDHRLIDGREAVLFLVHIKNLLEDPSNLLLEG